MTIDAAAPPWATAAQHQRLVRLCTAITGDPGAADDLAQETLALAWRLRDRLVEPSGAAPWLDAIARNVCRQHLRRSVRRSTRETLVSDPPGPSTDPLVDLLESDELVDLLDRALGLLPAETRAALVGRYVDDLTPTEIAARSGTSADAVSMRLVRGRTRLRQLLEDELADEPVARIWTGRHGPAWRRTRLRCAICAAPGLEHRRDRQRQRVELRCPACGPEIASAYRLDHPTLGPLLADITRPGAVVARTSAWVADYWAGDGTGTATCSRCAGPVPRTTYRRDRDVEARTARGWRVWCGCGEEQTISLAGAALAQPQVRALRELRPGTRAVPTRRETDGAREVEVIGFRDSASGRGVDVRFSAGPDARLLAVVAG